MWVTTRTIGVAAASILTAGVAAVGVGTVSRAQATVQAAAPVAATTTLHCHRGLAKLPANLRADLRKARTLGVGKRGPALRAIRDKALHGDYGTAAQRWSERRIRHQGFVRGQLPTKLRQDLRAVHKLPADQRHAKRIAIRDSVLAGDYGKQAQQRAERVKAHRAACKAQS